MSEEIKVCPICKYSQIAKNREGAGYSIVCGRCGKYIVSDTFISGHDQKRLNEISYLLSGFSRELFETGEKEPTFLTTNIEDYLKNHLMPEKDSVEDKAEKLLQRIKEKSTYYGERVAIDYGKDYSLAYAQNENEFSALLNFVQDSGLTKNDLYTGMSFITLTAEGWNLSNKSRVVSDDDNQAFIAIWFDKSMDDSIDAIEIAIKENGYNPLCIKNEHFSEKIMDKALSEIRKSRFVIVDLTGNRNSVFFEAGFAFGLGVEAIYVYKIAEATEGSYLEFYVKHYKCYGYNNADELKSMLSSAIGARIK
jgi:hypothetical protein